MRNDRHLAIKLRKQKKSYNEISKELGIPKSTIHYWFKENPWSEKIKKELMKKVLKLRRKQLKMMAGANKKKWEEWHIQCQQEAIKEFPSLKNNQLFLAGLMLYWGEGDKQLRNGIVRIGNIDPELIKLFYLFLTRALGIPEEQIYIKLTLYPDLEEKKYKRFWSNLLSVPITQFKNSITILGRHPTRRISYGICSIEVYSRKLKEKILIWIKLYSDVLNKKYAGVV